VVGDWWAVAGTWSCVINVKDSTSRELFVRTWNYLCCVVVLTVILQPIITCEKLMTHPTYMPKQSSKKLHMGHHPIPSSNTHTHTHREPWSPGLLWPIWSGPTRQLPRWCVFINRRGAMRLKNDHKILQYLWYMRMMLLIYTRMVRPPHRQQLCA